MRLVSRFATVLALLATLLVPPARAEDAPPLPRPVPPPRPEVAGLLDRLLSEDGNVRADAEGAVRKASAEVLRVLLLAMRDRAGRAEQGGGTGLARDRAPDAAEFREDRAVSQQMRFLEIEASAASRLLAVPEGASDPVHRLLHADEAKALSDALAREPGTTHVAHPATTTHDGQRATVEVLGRSSYVADLRVEVQGNAFIADPVIDTYVTGLHLETRARVLDDASTVAAALDLDLRRCVEPIAEETLPKVGDLPPLKVQRPEIVGSRWTRTVPVPTAHTLLVAFPAGFGAKPGRRLVMLYTPSVVPLAGPVPAPPGPGAPGAVPAGR